MKLVSGFVRTVGLSFVLVLVSTLMVTSTNPGTARRRRLREGLGFAQAARAVRRDLNLVLRQGWIQVFLPEDTESSQDHIDGIKTLLLEVASELKLTLRRLDRCVRMIQVHETDEAAMRRDQPLIPTGSMPRGRKARREYLEKVWVPLSRSQEVRRLKQSYEEAKPLIIRWVEAKIPEEQRGAWLELVEEFHLVSTDEAVICFEVHALHEAQMAVLLTLEENEEERLEPEVAGAWIRRAEKLITMEPLKVRLLFLKETLVELIEANGKPSPATTEA